MCSAFATWSEDEQYEAEGWCDDADRWQTNFVDWCLGEMPAHLRALLLSVGAEMPAWA